MFQANQGRTAETRDLLVSMEREIYTPSENFAGGGPPAGKTSTNGAILVFWKAVYEYIQGLAQISELCTSSGAEWSTQLCDRITCVALENVPIRRWALGIQK